MALGIQTWKTGRTSKARQQRCGGGQGPEPWGLAGGRDGSVLGMQHGKSTGICLTMGRNNIHYFCDNSIHERPAFQGILSFEASPEEYGVRVKDFVLGAAWGPVGVGVGTGTVPGSSQDRQTPEEPREIPPNLS